MCTSSKFTFFSPMDYAMLVSLFRDKCDPDPVSCNSASSKPKRKEYQAHKFFTGS